MIRYPKSRLFVLVVVVLLTANFLAIFAPLFFGFGRLESRLHRPTARFIRNKGRLGAIFCILIVAGAVVAAVNMASGTRASAWSGLYATVGGIGFQATWALWEVGALWTSVGQRTVDRSMARQYARERKALWNRVFIPGRAIVLRLVLPWIYRRVRER